MLVNVQFEYALLILIAICAIAAASIFFTVIYPSPSSTVSMLEYCNDHRLGDPLSDMSGGKFSCCGDNQICDKKWWTDYAPTISNGDTTSSDGQPTTLGYIIGLVEGGGVEGDFLKDKGVREKAHSVVAGETCKDVCDSFKRGTYVTEVSFSDMERIGKKLVCIAPNPPEITDDYSSLIHTGKCMEACNDSCDCKNFMFMNISEWGENGKCKILTDEQADKIIKQLYMKEIGDGDTTLAAGSKDKAIISIFRR